MYEVKVHVCLSACGRCLLVQHFAPSPQLHAASRTACISDAVCQMAVCMVTQPSAFAPCLACHTIDICWPTSGLCELAAPSSAVVVVSTARQSFLRCMHTYSNECARAGDAPRSRGHGSGVPQRALTGGHGLVDWVRARMACSGNLCLYIVRRLYRLRLQIQSVLACMHW